MSAVATCPRRWREDRLTGLSPQSAIAICESDVTTGARANREPACEDQHRNDKQDRGSPSKATLKCFFDFY
jgi:hypothetical protein